jgi:hypothetical protein
VDIDKTEVGMGTAEKEKKSSRQRLSADDARTIAKEAYIYGFPMVDNYRIQYAYFEDWTDPEYKIPWNLLYNNARVYTPSDRAVQTPNSDTPYSYIGADLRTEPLVLTIPAIETKRYFSIQFVDAYTFNFDYIGSRTTGNEGGHFLLVGPNWKSETPDGIKQVIRSETQFVLALFRTQLFNPGDIENVKKIQAAYKVQSLAQFSGKPASFPASRSNFIKPLSREKQRTSLDFFSILNFILQFCVIHPSEKGLMQRFAKLNIGPGREFNASDYSEEIQKAISNGIADAWLKEKEVRDKVATGKLSSGDLFGTREYLNNNYAYRMAAAAGGIYGNSKEEAIYPVYYLDSTGQPIDTSANKYTIHFAAGQLPPTNAFWSLTLYEMESSLLYANLLNRYLINSSMLPDLKKDAEGGLTLYIQNEYPGKDKESNWLPAPKGISKLALRLYWPKKEALDGTWKAPEIIVNVE